MISLSSVKCYSFDLIERKGDQNSLNLGFKKSKIKINKRHITDLFSGHFRFLHKSSDLTGRVAEEGAEGREAF